MNELYPIFVKAHELNVLIIGAGNVGAEKLHFLLKSSPNAKVTVVSRTVSTPVKSLQEQYGFDVIVDHYNSDYLTERSIVIAATENRSTNELIYTECKGRNILVNVADNPDLCDFYLGGIVTKGNLKVAISTNGKSPTMAKRLRQFFEETIPEDLDELLNNLNKYRKTLTGDFESKVQALNEITKQLITENND